MRAATPLEQPRAIGKGFVSAKTGPQGSVIDGLRQSGATRLVFPRRSKTVEAVIVNTAGGVTGGDNFCMDARAGQNAQLMITTQACERGYRAPAGQIGVIRTRLQADANSTLFWLPQETIIFNGAAVDRKLTVDLETSARFLMVEPILFGRQAMGEDVTDIYLRDRIEIRRDGRPLYRDGLDFDGDAARHLDRPATAGGARAMANLIWVDPAAETRLAAVRDHLGPTGGASLLGSDVMVMRLLGADGFILRQHLLPVLDLLTQNTLPQCWRL